MREFIHRKNLEHYRKLLAQTANDADRPVLEKLLSDAAAMDELPPRAPTAGQREP